MIGFASIAGGAPASAGAMTDHLLNLTLSPEHGRVADYYARTGRPLSEEERTIALFGELVADGTLTYSDALDCLLSAYYKTEGRGAEWDAQEAEEDRLAAELNRAAFRAAEGPDELSVAVLRPDLHPIVASGLGIEEDIPLTRDHVNALLAGRRADGAKVEGKQYAKVRSLGVDEKTGEHRHSTPIGSYDFCPTPDKSVSVAWAFAEPAQQAAIYTAHMQAARDAVAYIAGEVGQARVGKGGQDGTEPGHVAWLEFTHFTARKTQISVKGGVATIEQNREIAGDPDLHTHFLIPNAVFCESGRVGSLDTARIRGFIFEADAFYQAQLGQNLRDAGFEVELDRNTGAARLPIIPEDVRTLFSKRSQAGEVLAKQFTRERGEDWDALTPEQREQRIKRATQDRDQKVKGGKDDVADVAEWRRQAVGEGWKPPTSFLAQEPPKPELPRQERLRLAYDVAQELLAKEFERRSVLNNHEVRAAAGRGLVAAGIEGLADIGEVTRLMREEGVKQYGERTALVWGLDSDEIGRKVSITTTLHESQETEFVALARKAAQDRSGAIPAPLLERAITESGLDFSGEHGQAQLKAIHQLGEGGRVGVAIGAAGAGKSAMLRPLTAAWREQRREVYGASLAWRQADDMVDGGIRPDRVKAFSVFIDAAKAGKLNFRSSSVVCIDELGLLGSRQGLELLRLRERFGFSIVALGDDKQCQAVEAGAIIGLARRALGPDQVPEILTTVRQQSERERTIAGLIREGRPKEALDMKRADGTAELAHGGYDQVIGRVAKLYAERLKETGNAPSIAVPTNADVHRVGEAVRPARREMGLVGPDARTVKAENRDGESYSLALAVGDQVRLFRNTGATFGEGRGGVIGRNGSVLEIEAIDKDGITARNLKSGTAGHVKWRDLTGKDGRVLLDYGYALTIQTAQGLTSSEHILALPAGSQAVNGLQAYSGGTRHRQRSWLIASEVAEREEIRRRRPLNDAREISADDKWANVARNFVRQPVKDTAIALMERAEGLKRGSVRVFHAGLMPAEQRTAKGREPSEVHQLGEERRLSPALARVVEYARGLPGVIAQRAQELRQGITRGPRLGL